MTGGGADATWETEDAVVFLDIGEVSAGGWIRRSGIKTVHI